MGEVPKLKVQLEDSGELRRNLAELEQLAFLLEQRYERILQHSRDALRYAVELQNLQEKRHDARG